VGAEGVGGAEDAGGRRWRGAAPHNLPSVRVSNPHERKRGYCGSRFRNFNLMPANCFLIKISFTRKPVFVLMLYFVSAGVFYCTV